MPMSKKKIPESWAETTLGNFCELQYGKNLPTKELKATGYPVFGANGQIGFYNRYLFEKRKLLMTCRGATCGTINVSLPNSFVTNNSIVISPKIYEDELLDFIRYQLVGADKKAVISGSAQPQVTIEKLQNLPIVLPSLIVARQTVAKIESTQSKIQNIESCVNKAETLIGKYKEALLHKAFRGQLVPQDPNDEPASELLKRIKSEQAQTTDSKKKKKTELPPIRLGEIPFDIPKSWEWVRLGELIEIQSGQTPKGLPAKSNGTSIGFVKVADMNNSVDGKYVTQTNLMLSEATVTDLGLKALPEGAIIFPKRGGAILTNKKRILSNSQPVDTNIMGLVVPEFLRDYIWEWFQTVNLGSLHSGSSIPQVNNGDIEPLMIPIPPLEEQRLLVTYLRKNRNVMDTLNQKIQKLRDTCVATNSAILESAIKGHLVPQILSEGTGHDLLGQITEAAQAKTVKTPKKKSSPRKKK
jgi:type I restriction enzyme S subunit